LLASAKQSQDLLGCYFAAFALMSVSGFAEIIKFEALRTLRMVKITLHNIDENGLVRSIAEDVKF